MPDASSILGFAAAALVVLLIPGPGVIYVVTRSVSQGQRAGMISALGLSAGALVHIAAAAAGLSAILLASAAAFSVVKLMGAGYLIYLGIRTLLTRAHTASLETPASRSSARLFVDGVLVSVLNPKIAVFFLAFLPQFVQPTQGRVAPQVLFLGLLYASMAVVTDSTYALLADRLRRRFGEAALGAPALRYASGLVYVSLGVGTAMTKSR